MLYKAYEWQIFILFIKHYEGEQSIFLALGTDFGDGGREYKACPFAQAA